MAGVSITGERIGIDLHPDMEPNEKEDAPGAVRIVATAAPEATDLDCWCAVGNSDTRAAFAPDEIHLEDNELLCLARRAPGMPQYREGFALSLEPGMGSVLAVWLPRLLRASVVAQAVLRRISASRGREAWPHEASIVAEVVARRVLDGLPLDDAFAMATDSDGERYFPREETMFAALHDPAVLPLLEALPPAQQQAA